MLNLLWKSNHSFQKKNSEHEQSMTVDIETLARAGHARERVEQKINLIGRLEMTSFATPYFWIVCTPGDGG